jgi:uncharacterized protein
MKLFFFIAITMYSSNLFGQNKPKTILWEVTAKESNFKSYLFGTMHEVDSTFFVSLSNSVDKLKHSEIVFIEESNNINDSSNSLLQLFTWDKSKWNNLLTKEQTIVFENFITKAERSDYYNLPPLILNRTIVGIYLMEFCQPGAGNSNNTLDSYIEKLALRFNKPVYSLDERQTDILKKVSLSLDSNLNLEYAANCTNLMTKMLNDDITSCNIISKYKSFEIDYELDLDLTKVANYSPLLIDRNNSWIKKLSLNLRQNNCFIAVGLRHLFYKQGLIQQLRALGYSVTPIAPLI